MVPKWNRHWLNTEPVAAPPPEFVPLDVAPPELPPLPPVPPLAALAEPMREREILRVETRDPHSLPLLSGNGEMRRLEEIERETIRFALTHYRGQMSEIARRLGIGRSTLYRKMKEYGLEDGAPEAVSERMEVA